MRKFRLAVLAPMTGTSSGMGIGFYDSVTFIVGRKSPELIANGLEIELLLRDYKSDPLVALNTAVECAQFNDVIALLGPCDSSCAYEILQNIQNVAPDIPLLTPLATASHLTTHGAKNLFRFTTPDYQRAQRLVQYLCTTYPRVSLYLWTLADHQWGYSQGLKRDVIKELLTMHRPYKEEDFSTTALPNELPENNEPVICCSPSADIVRVARFLRCNGVRSQVFSFGSNTNLLVPELKGAVSVADLDRDDTDVKVTELLSGFQTTYRSDSDPSLATMNCISILTSLLIRRIQDVHDAEISAVRTLILDELRSKPQEGVFRNYSFEPNGEMIGHEQICTLIVRKRRFRYFFDHVTDNKHEQILVPAHRSISNFTKVALVTLALGTVSSLFASTIWSTGGVMWKAWGKRIADIIAKLLPQ